MATITAASIPKSGFTDYFIRENGLDGFEGFEEWLLCPEMLIDALKKWWGDFGVRDVRHQGLDLCCYRTSNDKIIYLNGRTKIPAMYDGVLVGVINDFLGKSLILKHSIPGIEVEDFLTVYGHTHPEQSIHIGKVYKEGETIAEVANMDSSRSRGRPHLHLSIGRLSKPVPYARLNWESMSDPDIVRLIDPLQVIDRYSVVPLGTF
jgi:hypothetical protein